MKFLGGFFVLCGILTISMATSEIESLGLRLFVAGSSVIPILNGLNIIYRK